MAHSQADIDKLLATIPSQVRGVGGAVAVVQEDGNVVSQRAWGFADLERGIPMLTSTILPICSISKHMLCLVIADLAKRPTETMKSLAKGGGSGVDVDVDVWKLLDEELRRMMPQLFQDGAAGGGKGGGKANVLKVQDLFNMQSGIRDYWAMTVLWGARAEDPFSLAHDAPRALERTKSFHFASGTEISYSNVNFHILGRVVENVSGQSLGQLLAERVFIPAGMKTAALSQNSLALPLPIVGYEGSEKSGYVPAVNGIEWQGDAGITASLEDMVAYEKYLHRSWKDEKSNYRAIATPATFRDGSRAAYSHGLVHSKVGEAEVLSHTGGLRGYRLRRLHVPEKGLSVVVMLNHETDPSATSELMLKPLLGVPLEDKILTAESPAGEWEGDFFDEVQQRVISVSLPEEKADRGKVLVNYLGSAAKGEKPKLLDEKNAESVSMKASIEGETLHLVRASEGVDIRCRRIARANATESSDIPSSADYAGSYHWPESESTFTVYSASPAPSTSPSSSTGAGGDTLLYASFSGFLGKGPMHLMRYVGEDVWILTCPRSMDAPAPGEWTIVFRREGGAGGKGGKGKVKGVTVGCWLARGCEYVRKESGA